VHGTEVITVERPWRYENSPRADAMVTKTPGIALGVLAADCAPVLFADPQARVIGAAHGGWRGALSGVMEATVAAMTTLGARPERIRAGVGPCIAQPSYEVGPEFEARFAAEDRDSGGFFRPAPRTGHFLFDLPGYIAHRLSRLGLAGVAQTPHDTAAEEALFFSYRRASRQGAADYGRGLAAIAVAE
jgi:YfiH family protein